MNRVHGSVLLGLCAVVTLVVGVMGCRGGDKTIAGGSLVIDFELPQDTPESTGARYCNGARSIVLSIDEEAGGVPFSHVLLLDTSYRLYGCGGDAQPCARGISVQHDFTPPTRVVAEWVDVAPENYTAGPSNVICRGLYDAASNMGTLTLDPLDGSGLITVNIPLLRVGAMNGYFSKFSPGMQPTGTFLGVSPLVQATDLLLVNGTLRNDEGGKILAAGGLVAGTAVTGVYVFEPDNLGFTFLPDASLPVGRAALTATPFAVNATNHFVVLAGGSGAAGGATLTSSIFTGADTDGAILPGPPMLAPRAHHSAVYIAETATLRKSIVVVRGCDLDGTTTSSLPVEFFVPLPLPNGGVATCAATSSGFAFCTLVASPSLAPACQSTVGRTKRLDTAGDTFLWVGGGGSLGGDNLVESFDIDENFSAFYGRGAAFPPLRAAAIAAGRLENSFLVVGGETVGFAMGSLPTGEVRLVTGDGLTTPAVIATMKEARSYSTATRLLDQRVLVTGGLAMDGTRKSSYELGALVTSAGGLALRFDYEPALNGTPCDGIDCSTLRMPRAEHSAEMIRGSATWINGSVVLVGGDDTSQPEIYVPAYACDATGFLPVAVVGTTQTVISGEVDFCDRGRMPFGPLMDPSTGSTN